MAERSDGELIARILAGSSPPSELVRVGNRLARIPLAERRALGVVGLVRLHGVKATSAERLAALWELADRWTPDARPAIASPRDVVLLLERLRHARREEVVALFLDARHRLIGVDTVAVGSLNATRLRPVDVFGPALRVDSVAVIAGHNHPSGDPTPSRADRTVTAALRAAGDLLGVTLLDHVIVARTAHHSFREVEGWDELPSGALS